MPCWNDAKNESITDAYGANEQRVGTKSWGLQLCLAPVAHDVESNRRCGGWRDMVTDEGKYLCSPIWTRREARSRSFACFNDFLTVFH